MFVVGKVDLELPLVFWFRRLVRPVRFAESEAAIFAWRRAQMTNRTDRRAGSDERLAREELRPVTAHARVVIGKVSHVGKRTTSRPRCWNLVTRVALEALVFIG